MVGIPPYYNDNIKILYQNIEKGKLKIPKYFSSEAKKILLKMLHRNPAKRPRMDQLQKEPFFADINWSKLEKKQLDPPLILGKKKVAESEQTTKLKEEEQMLFADSGLSTDEQRGMSKELLADSDYTEENKTYNRVKNYSFARAI